ncbi:MAG: L-serine ammonia-lyase, iron-sulfur-dependent, subunit alpha [Firmicutes bacterium]|nr:L-serine ammonia-lyase, iron-sulfur-dependent, subunit alpha [Bacillota bacterium]
MNKDSFYLNILKKEIIPATGCTEPAAVALAVARAASMHRDIPDSIEVYVSEYIYKNGKGVGIPKTGMTGLEIAAAIGGISRTPPYDLQIFSRLCDREIQAAKRMKGENKILVDIAHGSEKIYIRAVCYHNADSSVAIIRKRHDHFTYVSYNDDIIIEDDDSDLKINRGEQNHPLNGAKVGDIYSFCMNVPVEQLYFLKKTVEMNRYIAEDGMRSDYGLRVGKSIKDNVDLGLMCDDVTNYAIALTAAAADARMSGSTLPVMSTAGSGNQGLTASLPVIAFAEKMNIEGESKLRALALSELITIHAKGFIGRMSALCGCSIAASIGACAGIVYMLGGGMHQIECSIRIMVADIAGVICDGAKPGCALKIATAVSAAARAAFLAVKGVGAASYDGIVDLDVEKTLQNLGCLGNKGMKNTNTAILTMMLAKQEHGSEYQENTGTVERFTI